MAQDEPIPTFDSKDRAFLWAIGTAGFLVGLVGILHFGYMGQDFGWHRDLIVTYPVGFSYRFTNPPGLYFLGSFIRNHVSHAYYLEVLATALLALNTAALAVLYRLLWRVISSRELRFAAAAVVTFVPFRVIHSIVTAGDAFTLPVFVLAAALTLELAANPRRWGCWLGLSAGLSVGMFCKYTVVALLPPIGVVLALAIWRSGRGKAQFLSATAAAVALALPAFAYGYEMKENAKAAGAGMPGQWLPAGAAPIMRWRDILLPKARDLDLFKAPEYLRGELYGYRKYSYAGLLLISTFTDPMNLFQAPASGGSPMTTARPQDSFDRARTPLSRRLQVGSMYISLAIAVLAVLGTIACSVLSVPRLLLQKGPLPRTGAILVFLALGMYAPIFFSLSRLSDPYTPGYWLPRLALSSILVFLALGYVGLDLICTANETKGSSARHIRAAALAYTLFACLIFIGFLV